MKKYLQLVLVLFVIAGLSGLILGFVNELTKGPIEQVKIKKVNNAMSEYFPNVDKDNKDLSIPIYSKSEENNEIDVDSNILNIYKAKDESGNVLGYLFETKAPGSYSGSLNLLVGIDINGKVTGFKYIKFGESGPGANVRDNKNFLNQFTGKTEVIDENGKITVDTVSGATYTSKATIKGIDICLSHYNKFLKE